MPPSHINRHIQRGGDGRFFLFSRGSYVPGKGTRGESKSRSRDQWVLLKRVHAQELWAWYDCGAGSHPTRLDVDMVGFAVEGADEELTWKN